ncbi:MAG: S8 family serine peptidase, partial [Planctomycetes bacterium]|nr:S8 family serine peptidase [Planctomycetota bacterium]
MSFPTSQQIVLRRPPCSLVLLLTVLLSIMPGRAAEVEPVVLPPVSRDLNRDGIDDYLDRLAVAHRETGQGDHLIDVIVALTSAPEDGDARAMEGQGGTVGHVWTHAVYGFAGCIPAERLHDLAAALGPRLRFIEWDVPLGPDLDDSTQQARARPLVWDAANGYGLTGDPDIRIAICDSGIDDSHADLFGKVVYFQDFTADGETATVDYFGHGTAIAGIAAGTGASLGNTGNSSLTTTLTGVLAFNGTSQAGDQVNSNLANKIGQSSTIKIPVDGTVQVDSEIHWDFGLDVGIDFGKPGPSWQGWKCCLVMPISNSWTVTNDLTNNPKDIHYVAYAENDDGTVKSFSMQTTYPYVDVGDGFNLFRGMAPDCQLVALKTLENDGGANSSDLCTAFDWLVDNNQTYKVKVANVSASFVNPGSCSGSITLRAAADNVVAAGTVLVTSAGNLHEQGVDVADPGLAGKAITVGAISDSGKVAKYSANGPSGSNKPDVVAPGGSGSRYQNLGSAITAPETNDGDAEGDLTDKNLDDYTNEIGTSFAAPHVTGLAALVIQAWEDAGFEWDYTESAALFVKSIILMTATETTHAGESNNTPTLDRGGRDRVEGYGRINADAAVEALINENMYLCG